MKTNKPTNSHSNFIEVLKGLWQRSSVCPSLAEHMPSGTECGHSMRGHTDTCQY